MVLQLQAKTTSHTVKHKINAARVSIQIQCKTSQAVTGDWHLQDWKIFSPSFRSLPNSRPSFSSPPFSSPVNSAIPLVRTCWLTAMLSCTSKHVNKWICTAHYRQRTANALDALVSSEQVRLENTSEAICTHGRVPVTSGTEWRHILSDIGNRNVNCSVILDGSGLLLSEITVTDVRSSVIGRTAHTWTCAPRLLFSSAADADV